MRFKMEKREEYKIERERCIKELELNEQIAKEQAKKRQEEIDNIYQKLLKEKGDTVLSERQTKHLYNTANMMYNEQQQEKMRIQERIHGIRSQSLENQGPSLTM